MGAGAHAMAAWKKCATIALTLIGGVLIVFGTRTAYSSHTAADGGVGTPGVSSATSTTTNSSGATVQNSSSSVQVSNSTGQGTSVSSSTVSGSTSSDSGNVVNGSGSQKSEARSVRAFNQVALDGIGQLVLTQGGQDSLTIEADDNILPLLTSQVTDGVLRLTIKDGTTIRPAAPIVYHLTMRNIAGIQQTGLANIEAGSIQSDNLALNVGGPGSIKIGHLSAHRLDVSIGGSGNTRVAGNVGEQRVQVAGAGDYRADQLLSQDARVSIQGSANCAVRVVRNLNASIVGAGNILYAGSPSITRQIVGVGTVSPA